MPRLTNELKLKIIRLHKKGTRNCKILEILKEQDNFPFTRQSLRMFLKLYETTGRLESPGIRRQSIHDRPEILEFIDQKMESNDETTAPDLVRMLQQELGVNISKTTVKRLRRKLGWLSTGTRYCQLVKEANRPKRAEYCQRCLETGETFDDVIFTDQCSIAMESHARLSFRRKWEPPRLKGRPEHSYKIHVWAGISRRGPTKIAIFTGLMDAQFYTENVLQLHLEPFIRRVYPDHHRFVQDNDPKHTSRRARAYYESADINWWPTPPESPDLNPVENVWNELKHFLQKEWKPRKEEELVAGVTTFWRTRMTREKCGRYIDHLKRVIPKVIERQGRASGF